VSAKDEAPVPGPVATPAKRVTPLWAEELLQYVKYQALPDDDVQVARIACQAKMYVLINSELYRRHEGGVKLHCIPG
jgi:hypothetical protein